MKLVMPKFITKNGKKIPIGKKRETTKGSELYQVYLKKFPKSDIARAENNGLGNRGGSFSTALKNGDYGEATVRADEFNILKLQKIGLQHHLNDEDLAIFKKKYNASVEKHGHEPL